MGRRRKWGRLRTRKIGFQEGLSGLKKGAHQNWMLWQMRMKGKRKIGFGKFRTKRMSFLIMWIHKLSPMTSTTLLA